MVSFSGYQCRRQVRTVAVVTPHPALAFAILAHCLINDGKRIHSFFVPNHSNAFRSTYLQYGKALEYADQWATMGIGDNSGNRHFAARTKEFFGWIPSSSVLNVKVKRARFLHGVELDWSITLDQQH